MYARKTTLKPPPSSALTVHCARDYLDALESSKCPFALYSVLFRMHVQLQALVYLFCRKHALCHLSRLHCPPQPDLVWARFVAGLQMMCSVYRGKCSEFRQTYKIRSINMIKPTVKTSTFVFRPYVWSEMVRFFLLSAHFCQANDKCFRPEIQCTCKLGIIWAMSVKQMSLPFLKF